uniref:ORFA; NCBI gi: 806612 n=1 Tax=Leuconostoc phage L10 TaxID=33768 RepID=Q38219_9VIRU|nr:ORFA [Leuconostoc phage L10]
MASISDLGEWADHLEEAYNQPVEDQAKITEAGAKVLKKNMEDYVRSHHYTHRKTGEDPHLADSVIETPTNVDGKVDGTSTVGFDPKKAYIARFISDGTRHVVYDASVTRTRHDKAGNLYARGGRKAINGDDFLDKVRNASKPAIFQAENEEFQKILHQKGLDDV